MAQALAKLPLYSKSFIPYFAIALGHLLSKRA